MLQTWPMRWTAVERGAFLALLAGATGIGCAPILVRWSEVGPSATAFYRILLALPLLWLWMGANSTPGPGSRRPQTRSDYAQMAAAGFFFAGDLAFWHWSLQFTTVANSTLLLNCAPFLVTLGARLFLAEKVPFALILGMVMAVTGGGLLVGNSWQLAASHVLGDLLALATAVFYAAYLLMVKHLRRSFSTTSIMSWSGLVSCPILLVVAWLSGESVQAVTWAGWLILAALALVSHIGGQGFIAYALAHLPASFSSVSLLLQPVVAAALAWQLLHESLNALQIAGGIVILAGIAVAGRR
ncbi:MAG: DMT family transporter [Chloroflexi bacterium]|nr:DMT family transporter [Chloroflexota bacterium]